MLHYSNEKQPRNASKDQQDQRINPHIPLVSHASHLSSAILASGRGGLGGATSSSGASDAASEGVSGAGDWTGPSGSWSVRDTSDEVLLGGQTEDEHAVCLSV